MSNSSVALVKFNKNPSDPNDQWLAVQLIGEVKVDKWAQTIGEVVADRVPLQWTHSAKPATSTPINQADIEAPATFYYLADYGRKNPNQFTILEKYPTYDRWLQGYTKYTTHLPDIYVGFVSDRNIFLDADLPGLGA